MQGTYSLKRKVKPLYETITRFMDYVTTQLKKKSNKLNVAYMVKHKYPNYSTPINVGSGESTQTWLGENTFPTLQLLRTFKCHAQKGNVVCGQNHMYDDDGKQGGFPMVLAMLLSTLTG